MRSNDAVWLAAACALTAAGVLGGFRAAARARRDYVRLLVVPYRTDRAGPDAVVAMFEALHAAALQRWWRRAIAGQASVALELHALPEAGGPRRVALGVACPV